jgi:hypothetical protein
MNYQEAWNELKGDLERMKLLFIEFGGGKYHEGYIEAIKETEDIIKTIEISQEDI